MQHASIGRKHEALALLNAPRRVDRQRGLEILGELIEEGLLTRSIDPQGEVNNHVHTTFSFSPYFPSMATFIAWDMGLETVGCIDHDSMAGAEEMAEAGEFLGMATTLGFEVRVDFSHSPLREKKINNPDSKGIIYMVVHGVPRKEVSRVQEFLQPIQRERNLRNRAQVEALNKILEPLGVEPLNFDKDVYPISQASEGGSITERHILFALATQLVAQWGVGEPLIEQLENSLGIELSTTLQKHLLDGENPYYLYDLLGILKSTFLPRFFIQPSKEETIPVAEVVAFAREIGAIPCYAYLGDVGESPTGDKKAEAFEDSFLDELFKEIVALGFLGVTYMPPRNSREQLQRVQELCTKYGLMEISGVDINSPRQSFHCPKLLEPEYRHLQTSAWALIGHEQLSSVTPGYGEQNGLSNSKETSPYGIFVPNSLQRELPITERVELYATYGKSLNLHNPEESAKNLITQGESLWKR